jgi:prephenate dehydrogenase
MEVDFSPTTDDPLQAVAEMRVAILGLGLMGGSLALALRGKCKTLLGVDADPEAVALAQRTGIVERGSTRAAELLPEADLLVLAAPVRAILSLLAELPALHPGACLVFDLGSTKTEILRAMDALPPRFDPLGLHPICGKEQNGLAQAEASLFRGAPLILTPLARTSPHALAAAAGLAEITGARPIRMEAATHDQQIAATSHLPYLLACALALAVPTEAAPLAGPGYRGATRLAASSPRMMLDILQTNRENVLGALAAFRGRLERLEADLHAEDWDSLERLFSASAAARQGLLDRAGGGAT